MGEVGQETVHPGFVTFETVATAEIRRASIEEIPEEKRFVYFKDGKVVDNDELADEAVPIVKVRLVSTDMDGNLVEPSLAQQIDIIEFGPEGRRLRSTLMLPSR